MMEEILETRKKDDGITHTNICRVLDIACSSSYRRQEGVSVEKQEAEKTILRAIERLAGEYTQAGERFLREYLRREGILIGRDRLRTYMRRLGIARKRLSQWYERRTQTIAMDDGQTR